MTKFIAVSNRRGGVGKTTTTMMLAYGLSVLGFQRVLVIDLDPQASTSITMMGYERWSLARREARTIGDVLVNMHGDGETNIDAAVARQVGDVHIMPGRRRPDLHLLPSTFELDNREREILLMAATAGPTVEQIFSSLRQRVSNILRSFEGHYDVVLMDCPPGLSNVAWGALSAADFVLVPYIPDATAQDNIGWFHKELMRQDPNKQVRVLPNRVRSNNAFQAGIIDAIHDRYPSAGITMPMRSAIAGALDFRTNSEPLRSKFGDGANIVDNLFHAVLRWFEQAPTASSDVSSATPVVTGDDDYFDQSESAPSHDTISLEDLQDAETANWQAAEAASHEED